MIGQQAAPFFLPFNSIRREKHLRKLDCEVAKGTFRSRKYAIFLAQAKQATRATKWYQLWRETFRYLWANSENQQNTFFRLRRASLVVKINDATSSSWKSNACYTKTIASTIFTNPKYFFSKKEIINIPVSQKVRKKNQNWTTLFGTKFSVVNKVTSLDRGFYTVRKMTIYFFYDSFS